MWYIASKPKKKRESLMKSTIYVVIFLLSTSVFAVSDVKLDDIVGVYNLTSVKQIPYLEAGMTVEYRLGISKKKDSLGDNIVGLNEIYKKQLPDGSEIILSELKCEGTATLDQKLVMSANVTCENESSFEQRLTFTNIKNLSSAPVFTAPVYSSLYGQEIDMVFKKYN